VRTNKRSSVQGRTTRPGALDPDADQGQSQTHAALAMGIFTSSHGRELKAQVGQLIGLRMHCRVRIQVADSPICRSSLQTVRQAR